MKILTDGRWDINYTTGMLYEYFHQMTPKVPNFYQLIEISINDDHKRSIDE